VARDGLVLNGAKILVFWRGQISANQFHDVGHPSF
jgi:hypothetical protein